MKAFENGKKYTRPIVCEHHKKSPNSILLEQLKGHFATFS
jgi:hypothetical protein